jgi:carbonic anhydrase
MQNGPMTPTHRSLAAAGLTLAVLGTLTACSAASTTTAHGTPGPSATSSPAHWAYDGTDDPAHWASVSDDYRTCAAGKAQSPIDLPALGHDAPLDLDVEEGEVTETTADNGHTVQLTAGSGETTVIDGTAYHLQQMHFHAPSEHTVEGKRYPVELHFVHADAKGHLAVVAVFAEAGAHDAAFDPDIAGAADGETSARGHVVDVAAMLPTNRAYWAYDGSLTTPPCTEGVHWVVLATPIELGQDQIDALTAVHHDNDRPTQPLDGRTVRSSTE